jgi:hypothetical protein
LQFPSHARCKSSLEADLRTVRQPKNSPTNSCSAISPPPWIFRDGLGKPLLGILNWHRAVVAGQLVQRPAFPRVRSFYSLHQPAARDSDLVLAADVLANSLNYHSWNRPGDKQFAPLNIKEAVLTHPLAHLLNVHQGPSIWDFADNFFAHPHFQEPPPSSASTFKSGSTLLGLN